MKIGLHMVVKGDLDKIGACLESQIGFADYFSIAVDPRPDDDEVFAKCKSIVGDGVYRQAWPKHFAKARNASLQHLLDEHPDTDYVYWMDSDDVCNSNLVEIRKRIEDVQPYMVRCIYDYPPNLSYRRTRLWCVLDGKSSRIWSGSIHEVDVAAFYIDRPSVFWDDWVITHMRDSSNPLRHYENIEILEQNIEDARGMYYLGREYAYTGDFPNAFKWLYRYLDQEGTYPPERYEVFLELYRAYKRIQALGLAKVVLFRALELLPWLPFAPVYLGDLYREAGDYKKAAQWYKYALDSEGGECYFDWKVLRTYWAAKWYAVVLHKLGRAESEWKHYAELYDERGNLINGDKPNTT